MGGSDGRAGAEPPVPDGAVLPESRTPVAETLQREAQERYERIAAQWSPRSRARVLSLTDMVTGAVRAFVATRVSGLAAEMAFWGVFALPWVALGVVAGLSTFESITGVDLIAPVRSDLLTAAANAFNQQTMDAVITPMVTNLFAYGSSGLSLASFVVALWSGSKVVSTAVQAVVLVSGEAYEGYIRTRARALLIYAAGLLGLIPALILLLIGPGVADALLGFSGEVMYWLFMLTLVVGLLSGLYTFSPRQRPRWRDTLVGASAATAGWVAASFGLRVYVAISIKSGSVYAIVGAPIALLLWAYLTAFVVLLGALLNRVLEQRRTQRRQPTDGAAREFA